MLRFIESAARERKGVSCPWFVQVVNHRDQQESNSPNITPTAPIVRGLWFSGVVAKLRPGFARLTNSIFFRGHGREPSDATSRRATPFHVQTNDRVGIAASSDEVDIHMTGIRAVDDRTHHRTADMQCSRGVTSSLLPYVDRHAIVVRGLRGEIRLTWLTRWAVYAAMRHSPEDTLPSIQRLNSSSSWDMLQASETG
nr:hypothetical protein CFP56_13455 [Quercus suber]